MMLSESLGEIDVVPDRKPSAPLIQSATFDPVIRFVSETVIRASRWAELIRQQDLAGLGFSSQPPRIRIDQDDQYDWVVSVEHSEPARQTPALASELSTAIRVQAITSQIRLNLTPDPMRLEIIRSGILSNREYRSSTVDHRQRAVFLAFERAFAPPADLPLEGQYTYETSAHIHYLVNSMNAQRSADCIQTFPDGFADPRIRYLIGELLLRFHGSGSPTNFFRLEDLYSTAIGVAGDTQAAHALKNTVYASYEQIVNGGDATAQQAMLKAAYAFTNHDTTTVIPLANIPFTDTTTDKKTGLRVVMQGERKTVVYPATGYTTFPDYENVSLSAIPMRARKMVSQAEIISCLARLSGEDATEIALELLLSN